MNDTIRDYIARQGTVDGLAHPEFAHNEDGVPCFRLDRCITPAVEALWAAGVKTLGCCCGHGAGHGVISIITEELVPSG